MRRKDKERALGGSTECVGPQATAVAPSYAWPIARTIAVQGDVAIELIADSLGTIGVFVQGELVAQISPERLAAIAAVAGEMAADLIADQAARRRPIR